MRTVPSGFMKKKLCGQTYTIDFNNNIQQSNSSRSTVTSSLYYGKSTAKQIGCAQGWIEESFENIIQKLIHAKFQLFNIFLTFFQENIRIFQETALANLKKFLI
jgi:hypothetical protein